MGSSGSPSLMNRNILPSDPGRALQTGSLSEHKQAGDTGHDPFSFHTNMYSPAHATLPLAPGPVGSRAISTDASGRSAQPIGAVSQTTPPPTGNITKLPSPQPPPPVSLSLTCPTQTPHPGPPGQGQAPPVHTRTPKGAEAPGRPRSVTTYPSADTSAPRPADSPHPQRRARAGPPA